MLTTFHRNALDSTLGQWLGPFGVHQVTVPHPPLGKDQGRGRTRGGEGKHTRTLEYKHTYKHTATCSRRATRRIQTNTQTKPNLQGNLGECRASARPREGGHKGRVSVPVGTSGCTRWFEFSSAFLIPSHWGGLFVVGACGTVVPMLTGAAAAPRRPPRRRPMLPVPSFPCQ